jgi:DNA-binding protein YbaB
MLDKMKQLMEMKRQADQIKRDLDQITIEVNEVKGIKIVISGSQDFRSLEIDEGLLAAGNKGRLQADCLRSINAAIKKSQAAAAQKMAALMPGLT